MTAEVGQSRLCALSLTSAAINMPRPPAPHPYHEPDVPIREALAAAQETVVTLDSLDQSGLRPFFDDVNSIVHRLDSWFETFLRVDWVTTFSARKGAIGHAYHRPAGKLIVLGMHFIAGLLVDEVNTVQTSGPYRIGEKVIAVGDLTLIFVEWMYLHELIHVVEGHFEYEAANGVDPLTRKALERDADLTATKLAHFLYSASLKHLFNDEQIRQLIFASQFVVMRKLLEQSSGNPFWHPTFEQRLFFSLVECATIGRTFGGEVRPERMTDVGKTITDLTSLFSELDARYNGNGASSEAKRRFNEIAKDPGRSIGEIVNRWDAIAADVRQYRYPRQGPTNLIG